MKKILYLLISLFILASCGEQTVIIPDANFKNALLNTNCIDTDGDGKADNIADKNKDGKIQLSEIEQLEFLDVSSQNIKSLEGIQHFVNLTELDCYKNEISSLDLSKNTRLEVIFCFDNQITAMDLSKNTELIEIGARGNQLTSLDLSQNKKLRIAYIYRNQLTSLNLNNGNNANMSSMWAFDNPNLLSIQVDDKNFQFPSCDRDDYSGWCKDSTAEYN